jgi:eukaryotic-like serine/threonine-protein kinase
MAKVKLLDPSDTKRKLDRYELIGELASGGMATVYLARLAGVGGFQRFVAIKRLHPHLANEEEFIEMFLDEARLAAGIHHPHVVPILEVGQTENGYYLVMEYVEGDTLARIVARALSGGKGVPRSILLRILLDTLAGLHAAHELNDAHGQTVSLIHRDCSPQNVLVGVDGCSRITDFGVARATSRIASTRTDRVKGKLAYMSPEQAKGDSDIDRRSDLFAMGVILWEVLAGRRLFKADNERETIRRILIDPIPRLSTMIPNLHPALDDVCARALERDPDRRFQTAAEMADGLERAARVAATASPNEVGVASPREVAGYVQAALGQDIAAQRESVRAWLAHSEPSLPAVSVRQVKPGYDVTMKLPLERQSAPRANMKSIPPSAVPARNLTPPPMPRTLLGVGPAADAASEHLRGGARLEVVNDEGEQQLLSDDTDQHETQLMMRDDMRAKLKLGNGSIPVAAVSAPADHDGSIDASVRAASVEQRHPPDFQDPTPLASTGARHSFGPSRRPQAIAVVLGVLLLLGGVLIWTRIRPTGLASDGPPPQPRELVPMATEPRRDPPPPTASVAPPPPPPPEVASAVPTAPSAPDVPEKPSISHVSSGGHGRKPAPSATAAAGAPVKPTADPPKPPPGGGEDLANPYR